MKIIYSAIQYSTREGYVYIFKLQCQYHMYTWVLMLHSMLYIYRYVLELYNLLCTVCIRHFVHMFVGQVNPRGI